MDVASLIILGIQASIRLGQAGFKAYVDATRNRDLILPPPQSNYGKPISTFQNAVNHFATGSLKQFADNPEVKRIMGQANSTPEDQAILIRLANEFSYLISNQWQQNQGPSTCLPFDEAIGLVTLKSFGDPNQQVTPARRMASTLVEIGLDFAAQRPDLFAKFSSTGEVLRGVLNGIGAFDFATGNLKQLPQLMFVGMLETLASSPDTFGRDERVQVLAQAAAAKTAELIKAQIPQDTQGNTATQERIEKIGALVFRGIIEGAGAKALTDPGKLLGVGGKSSPILVQNVGNAVLELILSKDGIDIDGLFCRSGAERLTRTALEVVARHPDLAIPAGNNQTTALQAILQDVSDTLLVNNKLLDMDMVPEVARLILEKTSGNLDILWPEAARKAGGKHLLLVVAQATLTALSTKASNQVWKPALGREELLQILETAFDEVQSNPGWLTGGDKYLSTALGEVLNDVMSILHKPGYMIQNRSIVVILGCVLKSLAQRQELFEKATPLQKMTLIADIVDKILYLIFSLGSAQDKWAYCRPDFIEVLITVVLSEISKKKISQQSITNLGTYLSWLNNAISNGHILSVEIITNKASNSF